MKFGKNLQIADLRKFKWLPFLTEGTNWPESLHAGFYLWLIKGTVHQKYDVVLKYAKLIPILASVIIFAKFSKYSPPATKRDKIGLLFHLLFLIF